MFLGGSAYLFFQVSRLHSTQVLLPSGGLQIHRGGHSSVIPWYQIETVWHSQPSVHGDLEGLVAHWIGSFQDVYTLQTREGERFVLNSHFEGIAALREALWRETTPRLLSGALKKYQIEGTLEFAKLAVGQDGLRNGGKTLPWSDVGSVSVRDGFVFATRRNGRRAWIAVSIQKVPNLYVYLALVQSILKTREMSRRDQAQARMAFTTSARAAAAH
jgi:hypothetical protein